MTADFKEVYWLLEHNFQLVNMDGHCYYLFTIEHKCFYVRRIDPTTENHYFKDQYICYVNKATGKGDIIFSRSIDFGSKEWISGTGITPKYAINNAINMALLDPSVQHKEELRTFSLLLNPIVWFFRNIINYIKNR